MPEKKYLGDLLEEIGWTVYLCSVQKFLITAEASVCCVAIDFFVYMQTLYGALTPCQHCNGAGEACDYCFWTTGSDAPSFFLHQGYQRCLINLYVLKIIIMCKLILTKESSESEIKAYFNAVLELSRSDNEFPINFDEVWALVYQRKDHAIRELKSSDLFIQGVDYQVFPKNGENPKGGRPTEVYYLSVSCMEYFIARKVRPVFEVYRQVFHRVANASTLSSDETFSAPKSPFDLRLQLRYLTLCWHLGFNSQEIASMVSQMAREIDNDETFFQLVETVRREFKTADMALRCMMVEYGQRRGFAVPEPVEVISQKYIPHMLMTTEHLLALSGHSDITVERFYKALMDQGLLSRSRLYNLVDKQGNPRTEWEVTMAGDYYGRNAEMGGSFGYVRPMWWGDRFHQLLLESRVLEDYTGGSLIVCGEEVTE